MVSPTKHTETRRAIRQRRAGRAAKRSRFHAGTPSFPVQPQGYDPKAPDAKPGDTQSTDK